MTGCQEARQVLGTRVGVWSVYDGGSPCHRGWSLYSGTRVSDVERFVRYLDGTFPATGAALIGQLEDVSLTADVAVVALDTASVATL